MPIGDLLRRRPEGQPCPSCGAAVPLGATYCPNCGVRPDDPDALPLHIVDRSTGLFNDRFIRPVLEDELARAHRYGRNLGVLLVEAAAVEGAGDEVLKQIAAAIAGTIREVDTPGVLERQPPRVLAVLPDTDMAGTAHAAGRVLAAVNKALDGDRASLGLVCISSGQRVRSGAVIEAAARSAKTGRPEILGR